MHVDCSPRLVWASPDTYPARGEQGPTRGKVLRSTGSSQRGGGGGSCGGLRVAPVAWAVASAGAAAGRGIGRGIGQRRRCVRWCRHGRWCSGIASGVGTGGGSGGGSGSGGARTSCTHICPGSDGDDGSNESHLQDKYRTRGRRGAHCPTKYGKLL